MAKDDNRGHVYDEDGNDLMPPAPKRGWLWAGLGAAVLLIRPGSF